MWFTSHPKLSTCDSKLARAQTSAFSSPPFLFSILQLSFLSVYYYCFTCLEIGNVSTLINGLEDDPVSLQHLSFRILGFFYEMQFGKLLYQSTNWRMQVCWEEYCLFFKVLKVKGGKKLAKEFHDKPIHTKCLIWWRQERLNKTPKTV